MEPFRITPATGKPVPILISVPHCGIFFPDELKEQYRPNLIEAPDDTDWFVDQLYDFAPAMGITLISAVNSRWVIDLNRDPHSKPLYTDGRIITALCPTTDFLGNAIYSDGRKEVEPVEVARRLHQYFYPYHQKIDSVINDLKAQFGRALLWDCHSIRQFVPTIRKEKFPDLILGDADGTSCAAELTEVAIKNLSNQGYTFSHNEPFKGGYITRHFGRPSQNFHALQLEMSKVNYMDDGELQYDEARAGNIRQLLIKTLEALIARLQA
jgi:N-formylglutamate deformylase